VATVRGRLVCDGKRHLQEAHVAVQRELDRLIADVVLYQVERLADKQPVFISTCVLLGRDSSPQKPLPGNKMR
jgi:hypothetical protein